jgi:hypothetical protein
VPRAPDRRPGTRSRRSAERARSWARGITRVRVRGGLEGLLARGVVLLAELALAQREQGHRRADGDLREALEQVARGAREQRASAAPAGAWTAAASSARIAARCES